MPFRFDKLTIKAQEAVAAGPGDWRPSAGIPQIDPLHLLAALLAEQEGAVEPILDRIGVNRQQLDRIVAAELGHFPKVSGGAPPQPNAATAKGARSRPARSRRHEGRVRLDRASAAGPGQDRVQGQGRSETQRHRPTRNCSRPCRPSAAAPG